MKKEDPYIKTITPLPDFKLFIMFNDGVQGIIDLSEWKEAFDIWEEKENFEKVFISDSGAIAWNEDVEFDTLNCYLKLTHQTFEQYANS